MAKRRKLEPPSAEALAEIAAELSRPALVVRPGAAPIAQIAAEVAAVRPAEDHQTQLARQRDSRDAAAWREAEDEGRVLQSCPSPPSTSTTSSVTVWRAMRKRWRSSSPRSAPRGSVCRLKSWPCRKGALV
ncbi:hypothetical protein ACFSHQ_25450 [Gemmobacter lanyuensis]